MFSFQSLKAKMRLARKEFLFLLKKKTEKNVERKKKTKKLKNNKSEK